MNLDVSSFLSDEQDRHSFEEFNAPLLEDEFLQKQDDSDHENEYNYDREKQRPIPTPFTQDQISVPNALPVPFTSTPVLLHQARKKNREE